MRLRTACFKLAALAALSQAMPAVASEYDPTQVALARAIYESSPQWVHDHRPQALLKAVIVLRVKLAGDGQLHADVIRTNDQQPQLLQRAIETVQRARVGSLPTHLRDKLAQGGMMETWLFDNDGTFQVKTLAKAQMGI
jgi:protein TonB